jgi:hypothetical protein
MEAGMGIIEGGALGDAASPAFGRTINGGAEAERAVANMPLPYVPQVPFLQPGRTPPPNEGMVPGYPQDMFMAMDDVVAKPETYGMRRGWSGGTMGMMTVVRVLEPGLFDKIQELRAQATQAGAR